MRKIFATFLIISCLSSCGFQVIYREKTSGISYEKELAAIKIQKDAGRISQEFRNNLYDLFNPDELKIETKYFLVIKIKDRVGSTFLTTRGASGRNKVTITASYKLFKIKNAKLIASGSSKVSDNYDVQDNRYGTFKAEEFTRSNIIKTLSQNIRNLLVNDFIEMEKEKDKNKKS